jgi:hypothetical protein
MFFTLQISDGIDFKKMYFLGDEIYPVKSDDFFPYASSEGVYWTGTAA